MGGLVFRPWPFLRRPFGIGRMPDDLRAQADAEGVIFLAEFVSVMMRFTGSVPGRAIDQEWTAPAGSMVQATLDQEGLLLEIADLLVGGSELQRHALLAL